MHGHPDRPSSSRHLQLGRPEHPVVLQETPDAPGHWPRELVVPYSRPGALQLAHRLDAPDHELLGHDVATAMQPNPASLYARAH